MSGCDDMPTCAFGPCRPDECVLIGGCVLARFADQQPSAMAAARQHAKEAVGLRKDAPALNGTKARAVRDPVLMKRKRKAITR